MIIKALTEYYERKSLDQESGISPEGFEMKELPFLIVIDKEGEFMYIEDTREKAGNRLVGKQFLVPRSEVRTGSKSFEKTFILWDHIGYVLGVSRSELPKDKERASLQHNTWMNKLKDLSKAIPDDTAIHAMINFYSKKNVSKVLSTEQFKDIEKIPGCNVSFRLNDDFVPVPCRVSIKKYILNQLSSEKNEGEAYGTCIITGKKGPIARIHGKTPINKESNSLIGFQKGSGYDSYGKEQGFNAPIVRSTEFAYVTALNLLLKSKAQRIHVGDMSTVFWSKKPNAAETRFESYFMEPEKDDPDTGTSIVKALFMSIQSGAILRSEDKNTCYVLGLAPSSARISVKLWEEMDVLEFSKRIANYFEDFTIIREPNQPEYYSIKRILQSISPEEKVENIRTAIAGDMMRSILSGTPYPRLLLQSALNRIQADVKYRVTRIRAASIKAYLNRYYRFYPNSKVRVLCLSLDKDQTSIGYQLGRLFAVLERIQEASSNDLNTTIRDRYYGAACISPVVVFPTLLRLKNHHLSKITKPGTIIFFESLLGEIMDKINDLPDNLSIHEQGFFAVGYYHQRQDFYKKASNEENADASEKVNDYEEGVI
jgi:CRISPR-associated protein Csd1